EVRDLLLRPQQVIIGGTLDQTSIITEHPLKNMVDRGIQVKQNKGGIFISQDKYVAEILKKFDLVTPKISHLNAVKRIFKYLKGKPNLGLWYPRESPFDLEAFSDSDYGGSNLDRKSTTGGCQFLGQRLISWQCKKQTIVATSTTEAEYVAAANCCGQVLWVQNQLLDYGFNFMNTKIHIDNESTICIVKNPVYHSKTKHIEIRHHFIRDCYEKKLISVEKIHTDLNVADLLTKPFDGPRFNYLVVSIGIAWMKGRSAKVYWSRKGDAKINLDHGKNAVGKEPMTEEKKIFQGSQHQEIKVLQELADLEEAKGAATKWMMKTQKGQIDLDDFWKFLDEEQRIIQVLYERYKKQDQTFVAIGSEEDERAIKKMNEKDADKEEEKKDESVHEEVQEEEGAKKRNLTREDDDLKICLHIAPDEDKVIDAESLDHQYPIIEWQSFFLTTKPQSDQTKPNEDIYLNKTFWDHSKLENLYQLEITQFSGVGEFEEFLIDDDTGQSVHERKTVDNKSLKKPSEKEIPHFLASLGHSGEIRKITDVNVNKLQQPLEISFAAYHSQIILLLLQQKIPPKTKASKKKADSDATTKQKPPQSPKKRKARMMEKKERLKKTHSSHASGSGVDEGTGVSPGVPDAPDYDLDDDISWKSSEDDQDEDKNEDDENVQDDDDDAKSGDDELKSQDDQDDDDEAQTESEDDGDDFIHPKLTTHDDETTHEEETNEDDTFDPIVHTPSHVSSSDDEDSDNEVEGMDVEGEKSDEDATYVEDQGNEADRDTNANLEGRDDVKADVVLPQVSYLFLIDIPVTASAGAILLLQANPINLQHRLLSSFQLQQPPILTPATTPSSSL
ncbi:hypothetical protein Tco_0309849, partial [Tanacetum coccineum]